MEGRENHLPSSSGRHAVWKKMYRFPDTLQPEFLTTKLLKRLPVQKIVTGPRCNRSIIAIDIYMCTCSTELKVPNSMHLIKVRVCLLQVQSVITFLQAKGLG